jgi:hypothetical protein
VLGTIGGVFILILGMSYLEWRRRAPACAAGEGYGDNLVNEPAPFAGGDWPIRCSRSCRCCWWASPTNC